MMYRSFAIATLVAAPLIVMAVQNFLPTAPDAPEEQVAAAPVPPSTQPPVAALSVAPPPPATIPAPADFAASAPMAGEPRPGAGQPLLSPGQGLPSASSSADGGANPYSTPQQAPAGSPNAEY